MKFKDYLELFDQILEHKVSSAPYDDPHFHEYTKLNKSRMNRWLKGGVISNELKNHISTWEKPSKWILITEPWCGDAAHSVPFIYLIASLNPTIELVIQLRDSEESEIEHYLTNGSRSIPKLVIRDLEGNDLFVWGPRPKKCEELNLNLLAKNADLAQRKADLQQWYNHDKGIEIQKELFEGIKEINL